MMLFSLNPFSPHTAPDITIEGTLNHHQSQLSLNYIITGNLKNLVLPPSASTPERKDELWQTTCFEFFLGIPDSETYWEFNLSPAGHWNVYHFTGYRSGMQPERRLNSLPFTVKATSEQLTLDLELGLEEIALGNCTLEIAITTVLSSLTGNLSYWALAHPSSQADFHDRRGFLLQIPT
ncbi:MAG: DOMON-like domain-containing protein [Cyanobacteria bacterium P01_H01_bin.15]